MTCPPHEWKLYCLDKATGKILWERTAATGAPQTKRHTKSSQASSTPVTDGRRVVAVFGSAGLLVAWDYSRQGAVARHPRHARQRMVLRPGVPVGPLELADHLPQRGDPAGRRAEGLVHRGVGYRHRQTALEDRSAPTRSPRGARRRSRGPLTAATSSSPTARRSAATIRRPANSCGRWDRTRRSRSARRSPATASSIVTGGYPPVRPIYAIRPGAEGDISLQKGQESSQSIAWSNMTEGTYIPTPLLYDGYLFTLNINGVLTRLRPADRASARSAVASAPAARSRPHRSAPTDVSTSRARTARSTSSRRHAGLTQVAKNDMKEVIMATPAISDGLIVLRTMGHLYGVGQ